ncbi:MAG: tRNA pseudouridine(55) synthase TruB [Acidobacteria bacterium]|nr:tRNA pseudouridine(55) synthase TruB [Acidobacteriota bacterium]
MIDTHSFDVAAGSIERPTRGFVLLDKPVGWTSHDAVAWLRARLRERRIGHAGTLDPLASGLLPCLVGPATRLVPYLHAWPKTYVGTIVLGLETPTGDAEGIDLSAVSRAPPPPRTVLERARRALTGRLLQTPPAYSAKKLRGTPAHEVARAGGEPILVPVPVVVHSLRLVTLPDGDLGFAARVSSGTYIRSLARDLGRILGTGAFLAGLRRTAIGPLRVRAALVPAGRNEPRPPELAVQPIEELPLPIPDLQLDSLEVTRFGTGRSVENPRGWEGAVRVLTGEGTMLGIGMADRDRGVVAPRVVLGSRQHS